MSIIPGISEFQRVEVDGLTVEFEVCNEPLNGPGLANPEAAFLEERDRLDEELAAINEMRREIDGHIDLLTDKSDRLDCTVAVVSGVLAGIVDAVWVGEFSLGRAHEWGAERVNEVILKTARENGYVGNDLAGAIRKLEDAFPFAGDKATNRFGGPTIHHLRDLTHHPSPVGLVASLVLQFTGKAWGFSNGQLSAVDVVASELIGTTLPEKLLFGTIRWILHLVSDVGGSSAYAGAGTGLPGPLLSMLHEAATALGRLRGEVERSEFLKWIEGTFRGDGGKTPFDFRTEIGLLNEAGRQALPVLLNEALVRGFFFVRRAVAIFRAEQPKSFRQLIGVDLRPALPWRNRTITRMVTIASSTFTAVDLIDASLRAGTTSGSGAEFAGKLLLRVNFVGLVRTSIAIGVDVHQETKRSRFRDHRAVILNKQLRLLNVRTSYKVGDMWVAAEDAGTATRAAGEALEVAIPLFHSEWADVRENSDLVAGDIEQIRARDSEFLERALEDLDWSTES